MTFRFLVDPLAEPGTDWREINRRAQTYLRYLDSVKEALPPSAFAFATAPWLWHVDDHRYQHDSWVESVTLAEVHPEGDPHDRRVHMSIWLLGAYHDGHGWMT